MSHKTSAQCSAIITVRYAERLLFWCHVSNFYIFVLYLTCNFVAQNKYFFFTLLYLYFTCHTCGCTGLIDIVLLVNEPFISVCIRKISTARFTPPCQLRYRNSGQQYRISKSLIHSLCLWYIWTLFLNYFSSFCLCKHSYSLWLK